MKNVERASESQENYSLSPLLKIIYRKSGTSDAKYEETRGESRESIS